MKLRLLIALSLLPACMTDESPGLPPVELTPADIPEVAPLPAPDAAPPEPDAGPVLVPGVGLRYKPSADTACADKRETPILPDDNGAEGNGDDWGKLAARLDEENGGLDPATIERDQDVVALGGSVFTPPPVILTPAAALLDADGDCLSAADEARLGTDPANPDSDGDGWFDGPCNERRKLILTGIYARDEQEDFGDDELYLVADDVRYPSSDLDDSWDFDDGDRKGFDQLIAQRTRGTGNPRLALVNLEGWEDDFELFNTWTPDDLLFHTDVDLAAFEDGDTFTRRFTDPTDDDYDYEVTFRVAVEHFADPTPLGAGADGDKDGIGEADEARVARDLGGLVDPARPDVLVEVDWMKGHALRTQAKRQVVTQLHRHGVALTLLRDEELAVDPCVSVPEARKLYADHFGRKGTNAFRYAVISEQIWRDASGVAWGDIFFVDDSTWWIDGWVLPQAGTFIHELGHTLGLTKEMFHMIDSISWFSYESAMNYTYQATKVDYSSEGEGGDSWDHDDWAAIQPGYALRWSFALTTSNDVGICK